MTDIDPAALGRKRKKEAARTARAVRAARQTSSGVLYSWGRRVSACSRARAPHLPRWPSRTEGRSRACKHPASMTFVTRVGRRFSGSVPNAARISPRTVRTYASTSAVVCSATSRAAACARRRLSFSRRSPATDSYTVSSSVKPAYQVYIERPRSSSSRGNRHRAILEFPLAKLSSRSGIP